jgi:hypothetical protein
LHLAGGVVASPILSAPLAGAGYKIAAPDFYREGALLRTQATDPGYGGNHAAVAVWLRGRSPTVVGLSVEVGSGSERQHPPQLVWDFASPAKDLGLVLLVRSLCTHGMHLGLHTQVHKKNYLSEPSKKQSLLCVFQKIGVAAGTSFG